MILLTAILRGVHEHAALLRASIGSPGNDHRLGGSEAPPTILSIYLGQALEKIVLDLIHERTENQEPTCQIDIGLSHLPSHTAEPSDRNRTSFFAFTGNKFEFGVVGAFASCAFPVATIHAIVAESLHLILDEIENECAEVKKPEEKFRKALPLLPKHLKRAQPILFSGNGYSEEWKKEAELRGLPNIPKSYQAYATLNDKKTIRVFRGILSEDELHSRYEILIEQYAKTVAIEAHLMIEFYPHPNSPRVACRSRSVGPLRLLL